MDRRTSIKWMLAAAATVPLSDRIAWAAAATRPADKGYGTDPALIRSYKSGDLWPLTLTEQQRRTAAALCGLIIPADERSPSAADLNVHVFIDEWISAPYPDHLEDRESILEGFVWLDHESGRRFGKQFAELREPQQRAICDDICYEPGAAPELATPAKFFARYRDLTADGFYTTPEGMKDLKYVGNVASESFEGPPPQALKKAGLA